MKRITQFFYQNSNLKVVFLITAIFMGYLILVMIPKATGFEIPSSNVKSLGASFGFDQADIIAFFNTRTDAMIDAYINFNQVWDTLFGLIYGLMNVVWVSVLYKPFFDKVGSINLIPLVQVLFDWLENYTLGTLAQQYSVDGTITSSTAELASAFCMIKWTCSGLTYILILVGIILLIVRFFKIK
jgi:hypothetical protein